MLRILLVLLCVSVLSVEADAGVAPANFVERSEVRFDELRALTDTTARRSGCVRLLEEAFDTVAITHAVAGTLWDAMGASLRAALEEAISQRLVSECLHLLDDRHEGPGVIRRVRDLGSLVRVTVQFDGSNGSSRVLVWTLRSGGPWGWTAIDIAADGCGLVATLRTDFEAALATRGGNISAAIADLAGRPNR